MMRRNGEFTNGCPDGIDVMRGQYVECESQKNNPRFPVGCWLRQYTDILLLVYYNFPFSSTGLNDDIKSVVCFKFGNESFGLYCIHMLFFISLSAPMTSTASVLPVTF